MFRLQYSLCITLLIFFVTSLGLNAQAELNGEYRTPIVTPLIDPLELRAANDETYVDPNNPIIPIAVLGKNPQGGTQLAIYDVFPYLNTEPPNLPPQNVVDGSLFPLNIASNNVFGIDGIVGNSNGINMLAACVDNLLQIIKIDGTNLVDVQQISDGQCNEASITGVPGMPDYFYASEYDANNTTINVFLTEDGGDTWDPFYQITQNFGGTPVGAANGGVRHDIAGFNTALDDKPFILRAGLCVNYTETVNNGPTGLIYGAKCLEVDQNDNPNNFFSQNFDQGFFPLDKIAEMRSKRTRNGKIATIYPKETQEAIQRLRNWDFSSVDGLGSTPNTTDPLFIAPDTSDLPVVTANFLEIATDTSDVFYFAQEDDQRVIKPENGIVRIPNLRNYPCNQNTDNIVTPIGLGYAMTGPTTGAIFIACPGGSLLISELILSDPAGIPTINQWGLIALTIMILVLGAFMLRRRARVTNN